MAYQRTLAFPDKNGPPPYGSVANKPSVMVSTGPDIPSAPLNLQNCIPPSKRDAKCEVVKKTASADTTAPPSQEPMKLSEEQWVGEWNSQSSNASFNTFVCCAVYEVGSLERHHRHTSCAECAVIDSGATNTVVGKTWIESFFQSSAKPMIEGISKSFKFGDSRSFDSLGVILMPVNLSGFDALGKKPCKMRCDLRADIVAANIPLLVSRQSLKFMHSTINFTSDELIIDCKMIVPLKLAPNGHLVLPLDRATPEINANDCPIFCASGNSGDASVSGIDKETPIISWRI